MSHVLIDDTLGPRRFFRVTVALGEDEGSLDGAARVWSLWVASRKGAGVPWLDVTFCMGQLCLSLPGAAHSVAPCIIASGSAAPYHPHFSVLRDDPDALVETTESLARKMMSAFVVRRVHLETTTRVWAIEPQA